MNAVIPIIHLSDWENMPIEELQLPDNAYNVLKRVQADMVWQLIYSTKCELLGLDTLGKIRLRYIVSAVQARTGYEIREGRSLDIMIHAFKTLMDEKGEGLKYFSEFSDSHHLISWVLKKVMLDEDVSMYRGTSYEKNQALFTFWHHWRKHQADNHKDPFFLPQEKAIQEEDWSKISIERLGLSQRALNGLKNVHVENVEQILNSTQYEIAGLPGLGQKTLEEIFEQVRIKTGQELKIGEEIKVMLTRFVELLTDNEDSREFFKGFALRYSYYGRELHEILSGVSQELNHGRFPMSHRINIAVFKFWHEWRTWLARAEASPYDKTQANEFIKGVHTDGLLLPTQTSKP